MTWAEFFGIIGKLATATVAVVGTWWAIEKWRRRDEHFPRIELEVSANVVGVQQGRIVVEIVATVANKGVVPLKYKKFTFKLLGIRQFDEPVRGGEEMRRQLLFPHLLDEGSFIPHHWEYSFIYPGVTTEYNYVTDIPADVSFLRLQADLDYMLRGESHHAAKVLPVSANVRSPALPEPPPG